MVAPVIKDVVNSDLNAPGVFEVLMTAMENRLQSQFSKGRITGPEYATVYLGATSVILQQSMQFVLSKEEAYQRGLQIQKEVELTEKKILQTIAETENIKAQLEVIEKWSLRADAEIALLNQKKVTEAGQTNNVANGLVGKQQQLYDAQIKGFAHDTAVKSTKVVADIWSVQKSTDPEDTDGLSPGTLQTIVDKMLALS